MGGFGSGRPRTKPYGDYTLTEKGRYKLNSSKRFKTFAYKQNNEKMFGIKDLFTGTVYKRINPETYDYILRRFAVESDDKVLSRMDIYTKEGIANRAVIAQGNIISALNTMYDSDTIFSINGKEYQLNQIIDKLKDIKYSEKWIRFATKYSDLIDSFFVKYRAEIGIAPSEMAGIGDKDYQENLSNEQDSNASDNYEKMSELLEELVTTFKI